MVSPASAFELKVFIPIEPVPASRPRVSRHGTYYGKRHKEYQKHFKRWIESDNGVHWTATGGQLISIDLEYLCTKPRTSKYLTPRYDLDNLIKLTLDCITSSKLVWNDDTSVTTLTAHKRFLTPEEEPGTWLTLTYTTTTGACDE